MKIHTTILLLFVTQFLFSQDSDTIFRSSQSYLDSVAKTVEFKDDIRLLSYELTKDHERQLDKARAIFIWITDKIAYDYKVLNKKKIKTKSFKCKGDNCDIKYAEWEDKYLKRIIRRGKGVCDGYSRLFKKLCDHAGIQGAIISGYTKSLPGEIGRMGVLDHAWNVMLIDDRYYYLDATWAAGGCYIDEKGNYFGFQKKLEEYYWLTPIEKLSRNHFPADSTWIKHTTYTKAKKAFKENPYINSQEIPRIELITPDSGTINACLGDTIHFKFRYINSLLHCLQINTNLESNENPWQWNDGYMSLKYDIVENQKCLPHKTDGDIYSFCYVADNKKLRYIDVLIDYRHAMRFKVKVIQ